MNYFKYYKCMYGAHWGKDTCLMTYDVPYNYHKTIRQRLKQDLRQELITIEEDNNPYSLINSEITFIENSLYVVAA